MAATTTASNRGYWPARMERWGAWRVGAGGAKVATWASMRSGTSLAAWASSDESLPRTFLEERETHDFVLHLLRNPATADLGRFALAAYPLTSRLAAKLGVDKRSLAERFKRLHRVMARLLDQRKRGEALDAERRKPHVKRTRVRVVGSRQALAAVAADAD